MPPNILMITCDQLRKDALGCYGNPIVQTPNIDRIAADGMRYERTFTASYPVCAPNRGSLVTGRYPTVHGLRNNGIILPPTELTLMEVLHRHGQSTHSRKAGRCPGTGLSTCRLPRTTAWDPMPIT